MWEVWGKGRGGAGAQEIYCLSLVSPESGQHHRNPVSQYPPPQDSPESRQLLTGPAIAGPGRGISEGPSASDSVVLEPTSETSPSSPSVLCRRGLRCQFWMAWRRSPELRGGWPRSEPPLAAWTRVPKPPGPLSSGAPSSGRGSSRLSLS